MGKVRIRLEFDTHDEKSRDSINIVDILVMRSIAENLNKAVKASVSEIKAKQPNTPLDIEVDDGYALFDLMMSHNMYRQYHCLEKAGIKTPWELLEMSNEDFMTIPGIGKAGLIRLLALLAQIKTATTAVLFKTAFKGGNENDNA